MRKQLSTLILAAALLATACSRHAANDNAVQEATAQALETWRNDHFGLFIHFGIYSLLAGQWQGEQVPFYGEQIMNHARIPVADYEAVARNFNPTDFNPAQIVSLAKAAGMKYIVITTKHHDGFCMFHTATTPYNIVDFTPYGRDVVGLLADECQRLGMKLGFYYSLPDWHFQGGIPRIEPDSATKCWEHVNQVYSPLEIVTPELEEYIVAQITELLTNYGPIATLWFDMGLITPEQSQRFRQTVKSLQPSCLINGRIMNNQGDYMTLPDNGNVASYGDIYWDNPASLYGTWGYKSWIQRPPVDQQINTQLARLYSTVSHGGVFLLNIGPDGQGRVIDYEQQVLRGIGDTLRAHPDTLNALLRLSRQAQQLQTIQGGTGTIELTPANGLYHAAIDGTGYMSIEPHSYLTWQLQLPQGGDYDVFVIYDPQNNDKAYTLSCGQANVSGILPGVDRMVQTGYLGTLTLPAGTHTLTFDQHHRSYPLEPLSLTLNKIILRKK